MKTLHLRTALFAALALAIDSRADEGAIDVLAHLEHAMSAAAGQEFDARNAQLAPVVVSTHDLAGMAERLGGAGWATANESERTTLTTAVAELATALLASNLDGPAGLEPERVGSTEISAERAMVRTALPDDRGRRRTLAFELRHGAAGWRIVDLTVEGGPGYEELWSARAGANEDAPLERLASDLRARAARLAEPPEAVVARLQAALIDAMQRADGLGYAGRHELLAGVVTDTHDFESITKISVSGSWRELDAGQRARLTEALRGLAIASYAARFDAYDGQRFGSPESRSVQSGAVMVRSAFRKADGSEAQFDYLMRRRSGRWMILNIIVDGVSDLALKKTEYGELIRRKGLDALLAKLAQQTARFAAGEKD